MAIGYGVAQPKPEKLKTTRGRKRRREGKVTKSIRAQCVERDGYCRLMGVGTCDGPSEWAHLGEKKRARTRGMDPEVRHTTVHSMMLCHLHHYLYDVGTITITLRTARGANDPVLVRDASLLVAC